MSADDMVSILDILQATFYAKQLVSTPDHLDWSIPFLGHAKRLVLSEFLPPLQHGNAGRTHPTNRRGEDLSGKPAVAVVDVCKAVGMGRSTALF